MSRVPRSRLLPLWIVSALALSSPGEAQPKPAATQAWVMSLHYGGGNGPVDPSVNPDSLVFGSLTQVRFGRVVEPGVVAGLQAKAWTSTADLSRQVRLFTMTATGYPTGNGFYLRGGAGVCTVRQEFLAPDPEGGPAVVATRQDAGFAATAAAGWEHKIRRGFGVGVDVEYARFVAGHVGGNLYTYTAGLNLYW